MIKKKVKFISKIRKLAIIDEFTESSVANAMLLLLQFAAALVSGRLAQIDRR